MPSFFHFSELQKITFAPMPSKISALISRYQNLIMGSFTLTMIILSTWGKYNTLLIAIACIGYIVYVIATAHPGIQKLSSSIGSTRFNYFRAFLSAILIVIGLLIFRNARELLWWLLIFPIWRVLENNIKATRVVALLLIISLLGIYLQLSLRSFGHLTYSLSIIGEVVLKGIWFGFIILILYIYAEYVARIKTAERTRSDIAIAIGRQLFQTDSLESWCSKVLQEVLKLIKCNYASLQICNRFSGELAIVSAIKSNGESCILLDPLDLIDALSVRYTEEGSIGITGFVAKEGKAIAVSNVVTDSRYLKVFDDTYTEIAVPIMDLIHDWVGGVINVEYTKADAPETEDELENRKDTLIELSTMLAAEFSYATLSDFRNKLRQDSLTFVTMNKEEDVKVAVIETLYRQYGCPIALWEVPLGQNSRISIRLGRDLPKAYSHSETTLPVYQSVLGKMIDINANATQVALDTSYDHWKAISKMRPSPVSIVQIPLVGIQEPLGVIQMFIPRAASFLKFELDMLTDLGRSVGSAIQTIRRRYDEKRGGDELANEMLLAAHEMGNTIDLIQDHFTVLVKNCSDTIVKGLDEFGYLKQELSYLDEIKNLIDYQSATLYQGEFPHKFLGTYDLAEIIQRSISPLLNRKIIGEEDILINNIPPDANEAYCNRLGVILTIRNLLKNAAEARQDSGKIEISVSLSPDKNNVYIEVRNFGRVMSEEEQLKWAEPGFTIKEDKGRHGLGLPTSRRLLEKSHGKLDFLFSSPQTGTKFRISLLRRENVNE